MQKKFCIESRVCCDPLSLKSTANGQVDTYTDTVFQSMQDSFKLILLAPPRYRSRLLLAYAYERQILRSQPKRPRLIIDSFTEEQFYVRFRFAKSHFMVLLHLFRFPEYVDVEYGYRVSGEECFLILLRRLSSPSQFSWLEDLFGRSKSALCAIFNFALSYIYLKCKHLLEFDWNRLTPTYLDRLCELNVAKGSLLRNCIGFIDGTARVICRPGEDQRMFFNGHRRMHSLKYQSIVCPDGIVAFADGPYAGSRHDAGMFREGNLKEIFRDRLKGADGSQLCFYGDAAYPTRDFIASPYKGSTLDADQIMFNTSMASPRISVEWSFSKVSTLFAFQNYKPNLKLRLQPVGAYFPVATILTNCHTCFYGSQINVFFDSQPPSIEEYLNFPDS